MIRRQPADHDRLAPSDRSIPRCERSGDRVVTYCAPDVQEAYDVCSIALVLAGTVARRERL
jgi:hypothetical protein